MDTEKARERLALPLKEFESMASASVDDFGNLIEAVITQDGDLRIQLASHNHNVTLKLSKRDAIRMVTSILCAYSNEPSLQEFQENINNLNAAIKSKFI